MTQYTEGYENLVELAEQGDEEALREALEDMPSADIADYLDEHFDVYHCIGFLEHLDTPKQSEVFGYLKPSHQEEVASHMEVGSLANLFRNMSSDEQADVYALLDPRLQSSLMRRLARNERESLLHLASYEEGTVGAVMTSDYAVVPEGITVDRALNLIRQNAPDKETIYQVYVVDKGHKLQGVLSLRKLLVAAPIEQIDDLMATDIVTLGPDEPSSEASRVISRYDLIAAPVTNENQVLLGIVTFDDAMDVAEAEDTESMHKSATVGRLEGGLRDASIFKLYRKRITWLVLLVFANIFSGAGIAHYEETISAYISLLFFLPLLIASGGNAGAQAATLMVRGIATGEVSRGDWFYMLGKELAVSLGLGITMAVAIAIVGSFRVGPDIISVVALSMVCIVLIGSLVGLLLPFALNRLGWDPATASTPLVTTIADASGVLLYFGIATAVLGLPAPG